MCVCRLGPAFSTTFGGDAGTAAVKVRFDAPRTSPLSTMYSPGARLTTPGSARQALRAASTGAPVSGVTLHPAACAFGTARIASAGKANRLIAIPLIRMWRNLH